MDTERAPIRSTDGSQPPGPLQNSQKSNLHGGLYLDKALIASEDARVARNSPTAMSVCPAPVSTPSGPILPTDPPPNADAHVLAQAKAISESGKVLADLSAAAYLQTIAGKSLGEPAGATGFQAYRDQLMRDSGNPSDPIERMLIEQLALAHHQIGQLHYRASQAISPEAAKVYLGATCRFLAELRRLALALRQYRSPVTAKNFTVVKQHERRNGTEYCDG